jgi:uncharacterized membrane-anchored protein
VLSNCNKNAGDVTIPLLLKGVQVMRKTFSMPSYLWFLVGLGLSLCLSATPVFANGSPPKVNWISGSQVVKMGNDLAQLNLPKDYLFANAEDTYKLMDYLGNPPSQKEMGLVIPSNKQKDWMVVFSYDPLGYVKDDEAQSIDKDAILKNIKEATEQDNKQRQAKGIPPLEVTGWVEEPHYDSKNHYLVWAIAALTNGRQVLNYNTRKLGRYGVTSINLVVNPKNLPQAKPELEKLIESYTYVQGKQYTDFIPGQDKVAEIGLTALIAGGSGAAVVKSGLLTKILLFLAVALKKVWFIVIIGGAAAVRRLFGGNKNKAVESNLVPTPVKPMQPPEE